MINKTHTFVSILFLLFCLTANSQTFEMMKDINPSGDSSPRDLTIYNNKLYYTNSKIQDAGSDVSDMTFEVYKTALPAR